MKKSLKYLFESEFNLIYQWTLILVVVLPLHSFGSIQFSRERNTIRSIAEYKGNVLLAESVESDTLSVEDLSRSIDDDGIGQIASDEELKEKEMIGLALFALSTITLLFLAKWIVRNRLKGHKSLEHVDHSAWLVRMEEIERHTLTSKLENIEKWKSDVKSHLDSLLIDEKITKSEQNQVLQVMNGVNVNAMKDSYSSIVGIANKRTSWNEMFSSEEVEKMIAGNYWPGMTEEQLLLMRGEPDKIESEMLKTKINKYYIYGTKSTGDVFVFNEGKLERFKDR
jgi:hypothetical protein